MENKEVALNEATTTTVELNEETLTEMLKTFATTSDLPRGTVDEIFNLGRRVERYEQNMIRGSKIMKQLEKDKKKAEKAKKEKLSVRIARRLGYAPIPKEETTDKKDEKKK